MVNQGQLQTLLGIYQFLEFVQVYKIVQSYLNK